jgi:hypothetical protein
MIYSFINSRGKKFMKLEWPQITWMIISAMGWGITLAKHGDPQPNYSIIVTSISMAIGATLLYYGGFFG